MKLGYFVVIVGLVYSFSGFLSVVSGNLCKFICNFETFDGMFKSVLFLKFIQAASKLKFLFF